MKKEKEKKRLNVAVLIISLGLMIAGTTFLVLGPICNMFYNVQQNNRIVEFEKKFNLTNTVQDSYPAKSKKTAADTDEGYLSVNTENTSERGAKIDVQRLKADVKAYNEKMYLEGQPNLGIGPTSALDLSLYGITDDIYGYIRIDSINLSMPIYLGLSDYNMSLGAAHMYGSSLPYGGKNTNTVIGGHCGYGYMDYFRRLEELNEGDKVVVYTPFKKLTYTVQSTSVNKPKLTDEYWIEKGKDLLTLFTCHPYPTNKYRLCVTCIR